jgi:hypothetical protein
MILNDPYTSQVCCGIELILYGAVNRNKVLIY